MSTELNTLRSMLATAESNLEAHKDRLAEYTEDFNADPQTDTLAQIKRTEARITNEEHRITALEYAVNTVASVEDAPEEDTATFGWTGWQSEEDEGVTDARKGVYWITILDPDGEEVAVIIHRTVDGQFPLDGDLAKHKEVDAQRIVDALNRK